MKPGSSLAAGAAVVPAGEPRVALVTAAMAALPVLTLADLLLHWRWAVWLLVPAALVFVGLRGAAAAPGVRRTSLVLALITLCLLPFIESPVAAMERGLRIGGLIASLLVSVNLLSRMALRVARVREVVGSLYRLPGGRRYLGLTLASQCFGGLLGLAGIAMMMEVAAGQQGDSDAQKLSDFKAMARGYAALSLWSPVYSNMSIVLALYPGADWASVLPYALAVSASLVAFGALLEWMGRARSAPRSPAGMQQGTVELLVRALPVLVAMLCFLGVLMLTSMGLRLPIAAVIIAGAPALAWGLSLVLAGPEAGRVARGSHLLANDFQIFKGMVGEVMMFFASGCAGTVMASAIPAGWTAAIGQALAGSPVLGAMFVMGAIVLLSGTAIHPMLSAVLVGSSFSPQLLGLPLIAHLCAVLTGWGLAIIVTPFSVLSLMASRFSGIPLLVVSLRSNLVYVGLSVLGASLVLGGLARLLHS